MVDATRMFDVALVIIGGLGLLIAAWRYPGVLFALYLVIPPVFKPILQPHVPVDLSVVLAALCTAQLAFLAVDRRLRSVSRPIGGYVVWCLLAAWVSVAVWWSPEPDLGTHRAASWLALGFLPLLGALRLSSDHRHVVQFLRTLVAASGVLVVIGLPSVFDGERLQVLGADPISVSRVILLAPIIATIFTTERRRIRMAEFALYPLGLVVVVATGARGPILAFAALGAVWMLLLVRRRQLPRALAPIGLTIAGALAIIAISAFLPAPSLDQYEGLARVVTTGTGDTTSSIRLDLYRAAIDAFVAHPLGGLGTAGYQVVVGTATYPHDSVLQFAAEFGVVGLALFGAALIVFVMRWRELGTPLWTTVAAVAWFYLVCGLVSSDALENRMAWGALLLVALAPSVSRVPSVTPLPAGSPPT